MQIYIYDTEMYHGLFKKSFKYIDKINKNGKTRYIYEDDKKNNNTETKKYNTSVTAPVKVIGNKSAENMKKAHKEKKVTYVDLADRIKNNPNAKIAKYDYTDGSAQKGLAKYKDSKGRILGIVDENKYNKEKNKQKLDDMVESANKKYNIYKSRNVESLQRKKAEKEAEKERNAKLISDKDKELKKKYSKQASLIKNATNNELKDTNKELRKQIAKENNPRTLSKEYIEEILYNSRKNRW